MPDPTYNPPNMPGIGTSPASLTAIPGLPITPVNDQLNAISGRLRMNEERYGELRKKVLLIEQNMLAHQKKVQIETKNLQADIMDLKRAVAQVQDRMLTLIKELGLLAKKEDVDILKKYIELWEPVKFATPTLVNSMIEQKMRENGDYSK